MNLKIKEDKTDVIMTVNVMVLDIALDMDGAREHLEQ